MPDSALIDTADARATLGNLPTSSEPLLELYIAAATAVIENLVGPVTPRTVTEVHDGGGSAVVLANLNVSDVTVTVDGTALTVDTDYTLSSEAGVIYATATSCWGRFAAGTRNVIVTYTTGIDPAPEVLRLAALEELRFLWQLGQQGNRPGFGDAPLADEASVPVGYSVPRRVVELCAGYRRGQQLA